MAGHRVAFALVASLAAAGVGGGAFAASPTIAPFKDGLFAYPEPVAAREGGRVLDVPYSEARDIDRRDDIPERRVARRYVDLAPERTRRDLVFLTPDGPLRWASVGDDDAASLIVVFVHGRNGDRRLGMNDWTFGGNFNRLKNLVTRAGGLYATVDGGALGAVDAAKVGALLRDLKSRHGQAPLLLACGSMGAELCWTALATGEVSRVVDGLVLLGGGSDMTRLTRIDQGGRPLPILLAHGSRDKVYPLDAQLAFFEAARRRDPGYPIRLVAFDDGNHGTPIRMIDWRDTLNWLLDPS